MFFLPSVILVCTICKKWTNNKRAQKKSIKWDHYKQEDEILSIEIRHRYGVLIAARNEEAVIANLIGSIKAQTYDENLVDIFVVADNCTDQTATIARDAGATVYERFNKVQVGKGYFQVFKKYRKQLVRGVVETYSIKNKAENKIFRRKLSCYDMLMAQLPAFIVTAFASATSIVLLIIAIATAQDIRFIIFTIVEFLIKIYAAMFLLGIYTVVTEWKPIAHKASKNFFLVQKANM